MPLPSRLVATLLASITFGAVLIVVQRPPAQARQDTQVDARAWPMFGGSPLRNMINPWERNLPLTWTTEPGQRKNVKWVAKLGSRSYGALAVVDGKIFIGTNNQSPRNPRDTRKRRDGKVESLDKGVLMCFRESDGAFLWQAVHDKLESGIVNDWPNEGVASVPAVEGNRVYYVSNRCELICADTEGFLDGTNDGVQDEQYKDPTDADIVWRLGMMKDLGVFPHNLAAGCPLIVGDLVFVVTANGVDEGHINIPAPNAPSFLAVHKAIGKVAWKSNLPGLKIMHSQWGNPAYSDVGAPQVIFPGGDGWLYAFDPPSGRLLWKFDCNPKNSKYELGGRGTRSDFIAAPAICDGRLYIGTGQDPEHSDGIGHLWCLDLARAAALGRSNADHDVSPADDNFDPATAANRARSAFVWHFGGLQPNPDEAKRDYIFGRTMSTCAVHDGLCYASDMAGYLHCLDARTGQLYWVHDTKASIWASPYWVDEKIYLGTEDGEVQVFAHGKEKRLLSTIEMQQPIRTTPVAVNGVLYVATESYLWAIAAK